MKPYDPYETLDDALRWWWLIVLLMLLGGLIALGISQTQTPIYEARAEITLNVDLTRTGVISQEETDMVINAAGALIDSTDLRHQLRSEAITSGIQSLDEDRFLKVVFLERKAQSYVLRVQLEDPSQAAWLANRWAELAYANLQQAVQHAVSAQVLERHLDSLASCIQQSSSENALLGCTLANLPSVQAALQETQQALQLEKQEAHAIIPAMLVSVTRTADVPTQAVDYNRKWLLLAGVLLGMLVGVSAIALKIPGRLTQRRLAGG